MKTTPLLSIGMIFKNEERCLERCLKSLQPLRNAIPCELIMADTGAEDGSRAIAERYADEVFDFAWIGDFAAARNAVMDRCVGKWYLTVDCDEWLDEDISELLAFLNGRKKTDFAFVIQRNYSSPELDKSELYSDFYALRMVRMSAGHRYLGAIHESWRYQEPAERLSRTILYHDGYTLEDLKAPKNKAKRNMELLRQRLEEDPDDLRTLNQCIESGGADADLIQYVRTAVGLVQKKSGQWAHYGPIILSHALEVARVREMPELEEWIAFAAGTFPDSIFMRVDLHYTAFMAAYDAEEWEKAAPHGEAYRKGMAAYHSAGQKAKIERELVIGTLCAGNAVTERTIQIGLANAYLHSGQGEKALQTIAELDGGKLAPGQVRNMLVVLCQLHAETRLDVAPALLTFYEQIDGNETDKQKQRQRLAAFHSIATASFSKSYREEEQEHEGYWRPAYTVFAALADRCEEGRAAQIMMSAGPEEMRAILAEVEDWQTLPVEAFEYALEVGVAFPLAEKPLTVEVLDGLAARLTHGRNRARQMTLALPENMEFDGLQSLYWALSLVLAALHSFDWSLGENNGSASAFACPPKKKSGKQEERPKDTPEIGLALLRRFVQVEKAALPPVFTSQALTEENAALLPPMHRWGLYCAWALDALDAGKPQEYLAILRKGLAACPGQKDIIQFLLDRFMEDARPKASPELLALAERVRAILAAYNPDDPAVMAIRESDAYKQVSWIIEETPGLSVQ